MIFNLYTNVIFRYKNRTFRITAVWHKAKEIHAVEFEEGAVVNKNWNKTKGVLPNNKFYYMLKKLMLDGAMEFVGVYVPPKDAPVVIVKDSEAKDKFERFLKKNPALQKLQNTFDLEIL